MSFDPATVLFWSKKLLAAAILPPLGPLLLIAFGLLLWQRRPRSARVLAWGGLLLALALSTPVTVGLALRPLEPPRAVSTDELARAQAIVVLGGGKRSYGPEFGGETLNHHSLERVRYGAWLARRSGLPVLVSGGAPTGKVPEASLMEQALVDEFGVDVRWTETASRDTRENARHSAVLLRAAGIERIALITHAAHMARSRAEFEAAGVEVIAAPTAWLGGAGEPPHALDFLPGAGAAHAGWFATHEWLGRLAYRISR
ncbi:YdcF family protein [Pseudothauera lacus]|uniref:DUF218 domain-containing protein n=1 Tax=Pseudothauera lacus TaxID=2136175 RepID=A0A2T4IDU3_9RHOO|nr:YdcF family protein [Pseudothauera lacus]PTD95933.1 hypothetical protein C8261_11670 [Pseudothauera lacus]